MEVDLTPILVKELRGERDYKTISEELGVSYGQFFKIENGYSKLKYDEFIKICKTVPRINLKLIFKESLCLDLEEFSQDELIERFCNVWGEPSLYVLKEILGFTTSKWWRIKSGKSRLSFDDFIRLVSSCGCSSHKFLLNFLPENKLAQYTRKNNDFYENELKIMTIFPEACQITAAIGDESYVCAKIDNKTDVLRNISKLSIDKFNYLLKVLVQNRVIYLNQQTGLYEKHQMKVFLKQDNEDTYEAFKSLSKHFMKKQSQILETEHDKNRIKFNFGATTVSNDAFENIKEEMIKCFHAINSIIENDNLGEPKQMELAMFQMGAFFVEDDFSNNEKADS